MLKAGTKLGRYEIVSPLGAGGMGEVYRARDSQLDREIALKVLPEGALAEESARKRFRREAHALSRLAHAHVATLHDFDTAGGIDFLVMELVPGPSLEDVLAKGALSEKDVVRIGTQIARGLVAAHEHGVVHRDLKPSNIRLTPDGMVKILDFGLAHVERPTEASVTTESAAGTVAGTPPYMSPEQLLGKEVDARTDVYGAGVVLYQMATGRRPFGDRSGPRLVAAILSEPPPAPRDLISALSPGLEAVILKAIDKDPGLRYQTTRELLVDLERMAAEPAGAGAPGRSRAIRSHGGKDKRRWAVAGIVALTLAVAGLAWFIRPRAPRITSVRSLVRTPLDVGGLETDGTNVYYVERRRPTDRLMAIPLGGGDAHEIALPWRGDLTLWLLSRTDSPALLLGKDRELWRLPLPGGAPTRLSGPSNVFPTQATWSRSGDRLAWIETDAVGDSLFVGDAEGGGRRQLQRLARRTGEAVSLAILGWAPGDERIRFVRSDSSQFFFDVDPNGGDARQAFVQPPQDLGGRFEWTVDGRYFVGPSARGLLAFPERTFWSRDRPPRTLAAPSPLVWMRFTPDGHQLVGHHNRASSEVVRLDPQTRELKLLLGGARASVAEYSPDGSRLAWVASDGGSGRLWVSHGDGTDRVQVTDLPLPSAVPVRWSPDGTRVAFSAWDDPSGTSNRIRVYVATLAAGTTELAAPSDPAESQFDACWSPDGRALTYAVNALEAAARHLQRVDLATRSAERFPGSEGLSSPKCARDGRILAFDELAGEAHQKERGPGLLVERRFFKVWDAGTRAWTAFSIDVPGSLEYPTWSRDGRWVYAHVWQPRSVVRFDLTRRRLETVFSIEGLGEPTLPWVELDPSGAPLVHRDTSQREIVVMGWEDR